MLTLAYGKHLFLPYLTLYIIRTIINSLQGQLVVAVRQHNGDSRQIRN
jgi:hypothetical protein